MKTHSLEKTSPLLLQLRVGPLQIDVARERIWISRTDSNVDQQLLLRVHERPECIEAVILSTSGDGLISERIIGRTQPINVNKAMEVIAAPIRQAASHGRPISADELDKQGYSILLMEDEYWQSTLARLTGQGGVPDFSPARLEALIPDFLDKISDSLYKPTLLDVLVEYEVTSEPLIAIMDFEDQSSMLWIRWNPQAQSWTAFPFLPQTVPFSDVKKMGEVLSAQVKKAPRLAYFLHESVRELRLEDWINFAELNSTYKEVLAAFEGYSTFEAIAYDYHLNIYETEHHHNLSRLATSIAVSVVPQSPSMGRLHEVHAMHTDFALRILVDRTETALARFKRRLTDYLLNSNQELYKKVKPKNARYPKQCLEAFEIIGVSSALIEEIQNAIHIPTRLRHMWTHRGRLMDADFFREIGRDGQSPVVARVFGREVELREGSRFIVTDEDVQWFSIVVIVLIDKLYAELAAKSPA